MSECVHMYLVLSLSRAAVSRSIPCLCRYFFKQDQWGSRDFIACQGPLDGNAKGVSTVNDFWQLIWEQSVSVIAMVTRLVENGKVSSLFLSCSRLFIDVGRCVNYLSC